MTAPRLGFATGGDFQRVKARIDALNSDQKAILSVLMEGATATAASDEMKRYIQLAELGEKKAASEANIAVKERELEEVYGPEGVKMEAIRTKQGLELMKIKSAEGISTKEMESRASIRTADIGSKVKMKQDEMDYEEGQFWPSVAIGALGVGVSAATGWGELKRNERLAGIYKGLTQDTRDKIALIGSK